MGVAQPGSQLGVAPGPQNTVVVQGGFDAGARLVNGQAPSIPVRDDVHLNSQSIQSCEITKDTCTKNLVHVHRMCTKLLKTKHSEYNYDDDELSG